MRTPTTLAATLLATFTLSLPGPCAAQTGFTLYGGYRGGGSFQADDGSGQTLDLQSSAAGSISVEHAIDAARQVQLFASYQSTDIGASATTPAVPLTVSYLHLGGTNFFAGQIGHGAYVVGGLGATRLAPGLQGLSAEIFPSLNLGVGYQWPIAGGLALRFELRGYVTLISSDSQLFCSGGCVVAIKGDTLTQAEALVGLSFAF